MSPAPTGSSSYYLGNLIGNPLDTTIAAACLVFGGVLDRHPKLKSCLAHGGGFAPYQAGRWEHGWAVRPEPKVNVKQQPENIAADSSTTPSCIRIESLQFMIGHAAPTASCSAATIPTTWG